jgi:hypothetical protein
MSSSYPTGDPLPPTTPLYDETVETTAFFTEEEDTGPDSRTDQAKQQAKETAGQAKQTAQETAGVAKEQAGQVAGAAKDAGARVAGTTKEQASRVASDALGQARELYGQATTELTNQASAQQTKAASTLRTFGDDLSNMGRNQDGGLAAELVQNLSQRASRAAEWLEQREPGDVLAEVKQFAARRPGLFIALAATAGVVGARLTKALVADAKSDDAGTTAAPRTSAYDAAPRTSAYDAAPTSTYDVPDSTYVVPEPTYPDVPPYGTGPTGGVR